jgi:hypothetical protein
VEIGILNEKNKFYKKQQNIIILGVGIGCGCGYF